MLVPDCPKIARRLYKCCQFFQEVQVNYGVDRSLVNWHQMRLTEWLYGFAYVKERAVGVAKAGSSEGEEHK